MRDRAPQRAVTGRHTLGSPPESQEPVDPAIVPTLPAIPAAENLADRAEPLYTIYGVTWYAARERAHGAEARRLLDVVEAGWQAVRELQHWCESHQASARDDAAYRHLLSFVEGDLVDLFREVANGVAVLVPGWEGWQAEADPDGTVGDTEAFVRYMALLRLAVQAAAVPEPFAVLVELVAERLTGWGAELAALVEAFWIATGAEARE